MSISRLTRLLIVGSMVAPHTAQPQVPFGLDTSFRTDIDAWYVASAMPLENGQILISGQIRFPGEFSFRSGARLNEDGSRDLGYPDVAYMGGKITKWNDKVYAESGNIVRRVLLEGGLDNTFITMSFSPYFTMQQGGDYHVFPDGRLMIGGRHFLSDSIRGYMGPHCLCWFSNEGYLDTTRVHRTCSTTLDVIAPLQNGQFMGSGYTAVYDGQPASNILRFNADGSLDPSFQANVVWRRAHAFLPLEDGRVYAAGQFLIAGDPDTLHLVRFMPDGSLDPTFNNHLDFQIVNMNTFPNGALLRSLHRLDNGNIVVMGNFEQVEGEERGCICMVDSTGDLLDEYFSGGGCGNFNYQGEFASSISGLYPASDGSYYICGAYHGYDDGNINDTTQRMVSRLYGLDVGVQEPRAHPNHLSVFPNPSVDEITVAYDLPSGETDALLTLRDLVGREVCSTRLSDQKGQLLWDIKEFPPGAYSVTLHSSYVQLRTVKLIIR